MMKHAIYLVCNDRLDDVRTFLNKFFDESGDWSTHDGWVSFGVDNSDFLISLMDGSGQEMGQTKNLAIEIYFDSLNELKDFSKKHGVQVESFDTNKSGVPYAYHYCEIKGPDSICFIEASYSEK